MFGTRCSHRHTTPMPRMGWYAQHTVWAGMLGGLICSAYRMGWFARILTPGMRAYQPMQIPAGMGGPMPRMCWYALTSHAPRSYARHTSPMPRMGWYAHSCAAHGWYAEHTSPYEALAAGMPNIPAHARRMALCPRKETIFCIRALYKRRYSAKETYHFKEPTNRSHPISPLPHARHTSTITCLFCKRAL